MLGAIVGDMEAESRNGPLPLADAMLEWSEPALIEAIRAEEVALAASGGIDHFLLADLRTSRRSPKRSFGFISSFSPTAALERAWEALYAVWRFRIECGEVCLTGNNTLQILEPGSIILPRQRAAELRFDPAAGAVFLEASTYVGVTATRVVGAPSVAGTVTPLTREFSIADALIEWGDPGLVQQFSDMQVQIDEVSKKPRLSLVETATPTGVKSGLVDNTLTKARLEGERDKLRKQLIEDIRKKVERGKLGIAGVQTFPMREVARKPIPGVWASDVWFDVDADKVNVVAFGQITHGFVAVIVSGPARPEKDQPDIAGTSKAEPGPATASKNNGLGNRGRPNAGRVIETALRDNWDAIQRLKLDGGRPVWTEAANLLFNRLKAAAKPGEVNDIPQADTIRTRLPEIYASVLSEKAGSSNNTQ